MPVSAKNYFNIKRLNRIFAVSAILMLITFLWAIWHDHDRPWRRIQKQGREWSVMVIDQRMERLRRLGVREELQRLDGQIAQFEQQFGRPAAPGRPASLPADPQHRKELDELKDLSSRIDGLQLRLSNLRSQVAAMEGELQETRVRGDQTRAMKLEERLAEPRKQLAQWSQDTAHWKQRADELRHAIARRQAQLDDRLKARTRLAAELETLEKRRSELAPRGFWARSSDWIRSLPLLQFINPTERVQQVVVPDVHQDLSFTRVETTDRCITCHVNIDKPEFSRPGIIELLEGEVADARALRLPATLAGKPDEPQATAMSPGAVAMPEFWHAWGQAFKPPAAISANARRAQTLAATVGLGTPTQPVRITTTPATTVAGFDFKSFAKFEYKADEADPARRAAQEGILIAVIKAWAMYDPGAGSAWARAASPDGRFTATIEGTVDPATFAKARFAALKYPEAFRTSLPGSLDAATWEMLQEKYRVALLREVNQRRTARGLSALDSSPVFLAHPRLDLYASPSSPHAMEKVGCTSCHDGSGNETDFVLAAHRARPILVDTLSGEPVLDVQLQERLQTPVTVAYADPVAGRQGSAEPQLSHWTKRYQGQSPSNFEEVSHYWDWPMRQPKYLQASCARCHVNVTDIAKEAPALHEGRLLFARLGCVNCHQMDSIGPLDPKDPQAGDRKRTGSDLRHIAQKVSGEFINTWLWSPREFRPSTLMPHFFMLENNSGPEEIRRTRVETRAMTQYLLAASTPLEPHYRADPKLKGSAEKGQQIFERIGCAACHTNLADWVDWEDPDTREGPLKRRAEQWITTDLIQRLGLTEEQAKSRYDAMSYAQKQSYCLEQFGTITSIGPTPTYADGKIEKPRFIIYGPELSGVADKLLAARSPQQAHAWLFDWLKEPRHYSGYTAMPSLRLTDAETTHLVEYLMTQRRKNLDPKDAWSARLFDADPAKLTELVAWFLRVQFTPQQADAKAVEEHTPDGKPGELTLRAIDALSGPSLRDRATAETRIGQMSLQEKQFLVLGKKLVANYGCFNCHAINGMEGIASPCPNLSDWGQKQVAKLDFGYLEEHKARELNDKRSAKGKDEGRRMKDAPQPAPPTPGSERSDDRGPTQDSGISTSSSPATNYQLPTTNSSSQDSFPPLPPTREAWIEQKLANPRIFDRGRSLLEPTSPTNRGRPYDKLKMPQFSLRPDQIHALATFVLSNRDRLVSDGMLARVNDTHHQRLAVGRQVAERFNCTSCHRIEGNDPAIGQHFPREREEMSRYWLVAPPELLGQGARTTPAWLFAFLKNVEPIRPQAQVRMPSFALSDAEAEQLTAYFAAISQEQSRWLKARLAPIERYIAQRQTSATRPVTDPNQPWPGDDWHRQPSLADMTADLRAWGRSRRLPQMTAANLDPTRTTGFEADKVHRTLLFEARFLATLYDAPYPMAESRKPQISDAAFARGEGIFRDLECTKCHTLGTPQEIANLKLPEPPKGPNLAMAHQRLQWRWAFNWVQQTNLVLPVGSPMPAFFDGLPAWNLQGLPAEQDAPTLSQMPPVKRQKVEQHIARYGATAPEQKQLLLDFIYAAGARQYTFKPMPATAPSTTQPTTR